MPRALLDLGMLVVAACRLDVWIWLGSDAAALSSPRAHARASGICARCPCDMNMQRNETVCVAGQEATCAVALLLV